ncbi:hypothetical protein SLEP1_g56273 [Rubroshorea leprosula]|uniref:Uncharacterized protein n=1 Tax=Rubroshorea leprosula TaxID=152421 RepID=A0AAV5ML49_9ROSI|nr:hypothetical protein SLEP1_g56273 [Rubroshorea leprosula]
MASESALSSDPLPLVEEDDSLARSPKRIKDDLCPPSFSNVDPPNSMVAPSVQKTFKDMLIDGNAEFSPSTITLEELMAAGKRINYHLLSSRLSREWQTEGEFTVIDIGQGYSIAKFSSSNDCSRALTGAAVLYLGNKLGKAIKFDRTTLLATRGEFARVRVEVDLNESLPSMIDLDLEGLPQSLIPVKYEGLHKICFECEEFGHKKEACHYRQPQPQPQPQPAIASASSQQSGKSSSIAISLAKSSTEHEDIPVLVDNCMTYESWMVAKRKPQKVAKKQNSHGDNISIPSKGQGIEKGGSIAKYSGPPRPVNQEQNINTNNGFGVIALEEETLVEMPHLGAPDSGSFPTQHTGALEQSNMETAPSSLEEAYPVVVKPSVNRHKNSKSHKKSTRKNDKTKTMLGSIAKPSKSSGSKTLDTGVLKKSINETPNQLARVASVLVSLHPKSFHHLSLFPKWRMLLTLRICLAINATGEACLLWGRSVFGNIYRKKRLLKARITGIQNSPHYSTSSWLQRLERHWDIVVGTFLEFVNQALLTGVFEPSLTKAYVALIPKEDSPDSIQKFRPISLLNVAYKVLFKIIVNRLQPYLQELVGSWQSSFLAAQLDIIMDCLNQFAKSSVSWEVLCSKKKQGGLRLRSAWENNQAFVAKLGWRVLKGDKALWCKAIQTKYLWGLSLLNAKAKPRCSFMWRGILQCCPLLQQGVCWRVGTGEGVNFWHDNSVGNASLINVSDKGPVDSSLLVANGINSNGI